MQLVGKLSALQSFWFLTSSFHNYIIAYRHANNYVLNKKLSEIVVKKRLQDLEDYI